MLSSFPCFCFLVYLCIQHLLSIYCLSFFFFFFLFYISFFHQCDFHVFKCFLLAYLLGWIFFFFLVLIHIEHIMSRQFKYLVTVLPDTTS